MLPSSSTADCPSPNRVTDNDVAAEVAPVPAPELVHPTLVDGELQYFTSVGSLRSGPHPLDPQTTLWYLQAAEGHPDIPLNQMPAWVKQALRRPPEDRAPPPPEPKLKTRTKAKRPKDEVPSPSSSTPEIEIHDIPRKTSEHVSSSDQMLSAAAAPDAPVKPEA